MAQFNPQVPNTNDPNWLGWSKSITQPSADTSTGELLSTIGTGIAEGAKVADNLVKWGVEDQTYDKVRALQSEYTSSLEKADISTRLAAVQGGGAGTPTIPLAKGPKSVYDQPPTDLLPTGTNSQAPNELRRLPSDLSMLDSARGNNKLSETAYIGRLDALAKDLRARYPGYRDYIDKEVERVSGVNPANAYIKSILGDINSFATAGKEADKQVKTQIIDGMKMGVPGMDQVWQDYTSGRLGSPDEAMPKIMRTIGPAHTVELQLKLSAARRKEREGTDQDTTRDVEDDANKVLRGKAVNFFNVLHLRSGAPTAEQISQIITQANSGEIKLDETQALALSRTIRSQKSVASAEFDDYLNGVGPDGRSRLSILGNKAGELKKAHLSRFDEVADLIEHKEYGRAYSTMNDIRAQGDEDTKRLLNDDEMGQSFRLSKTLDKMGLDKYTKEFAQGILSSKVGPEFQPWLNKAGKLMITQEGSANGVVNTLKSQVEELQKKTQGANTPAIAKTYDGLISSIEFIADPKNNDLQAKRNLAKAAFDPSNLGLLTKFNEDTGSGANFKPGKYSIFNRLYSEDMTAAMKKVGGPEWEMYKDLSKQAFGRELFGPALKDLTRLSTDYPGVKVGWSTDSHQFVYKDDFAPSNEPFPASPTQRLAIKSKIDKINFSLSKVANIAKAEGTDIDAYLLNELKTQGVDIGKLPGIPEQMAREIVKARTEEDTKASEFQKKYGSTPTTKKEQKIPNTGGPRPNPFSTGRGGVGDRALPYDIEQAPSSGSLGEFLKSPVGILPALRNNAPVTSTTRPRPLLKRSSNMSNEELISVTQEGSDNDAFAKINPAYGR